MTCSANETSRVSEGIVADPLILSIDACRRAMEAYDAAPDGSDAAAEKKYKEHLRYLRDNTVPAVSKEGALAALEMAIDASADNDHNLSIVMIRVAFEYFKSDFA